jgi:hypothetical protein
MFSMLRWWMQALATQLPWSALRLALEVVFEGTEGVGHFPVAGVRSPAAEAAGDATVEPHGDGKDSAACLAYTSDGYCIGVISLQPFVFAS